MFREDRVTALALLTGYHVYTFTSVLFRLTAYLQAGLQPSHLKLLLTVLFLLVEGEIWMSFWDLIFSSLNISGLTILSLLLLHALDLTSKTGKPL